MKKIFSKILMIIGAFCFILCFCASDMSAPVPAVCLLSALFILGSIFCVVAIKIDAPTQEATIQPVKKENNIDYSKEFEYLYKQIILYKVNNILKEGVCND